MDMTKYENNTWEEIEEVIRGCKGTVILPIGSVEQHSTHLPIGTDSFAAIRVSLDAGKESGVPVIPPLWYGWSPHHMALPGTISIRAEILTELLYDILSSLAVHGIKKVVAVNGHRTTNIPWMQLAAQRAQEDYGMHVCLFDPAFMSKEINDTLKLGPLGHADEAETAHMLYCCEDLVHMDRVIDAPILDQTFSDEPCWPGDALCYVPGSVAQMKKRAEKTGGTSGEPSRATKAMGEAYHQHLVKRLIDVVKYLQVID